jgi:hypothetical protein
MDFHTTHTGYIWKEPTQVSSPSMILQRSMSLWWRTALSALSFDDHMMSGKKLLAVTEDTALHCRWNSFPVRLCSIPLLPSCLSTYGQGGSWSLNSKRGPLPLSPLSADLISLDFFICGFVKSVYWEKMQNMNELCAGIITSAECVTMTFLSLSKKLNIALSPWRVSCYK